METRRLFRPVIHGSQAVEQFKAQLVAAQFQGRDDAPRGNGHMRLAAEFLHSRAEVRLQSLDDFFEFVIHISRPDP